MTEKYKVRFINRHRQYSPGDIAEFELGTADALVRGHKAEWMGDEGGDTDVDVKAMVDGPPADKSMNRSNTRRKAKRKG